MKIHFLGLQSDMILSELMKSLRGFSKIRIYYTNLNILLQFLIHYVGYKPTQHSRLNILCISIVLCGLQSLIKTTEKVIFQ